MVAGEAAAKRLPRATLVMVIWLWLAVEAIVVVVMVAWLRCGYLGAMLVVVMVVEMWLVQNNDRKRKTLPQRITALLTRRIPSEQRWGNLSEHRLTGITDLRTFMVVCEFPQP